jgi:hypothetical protein
MTLWNMFGEPCGITTSHTTSHETVALHAPQISREATLSSDKEVPPDIVVHRTKEGIKGGKKRRKQCPQETMTDHDNGSDGEVGSTGVRRFSTTAHSDKCQARPPMDDFKRLLEEACPSHAYPQQAQAQRLRHDEELHDLGVPHLRCGA